MNSAIETQLRACEARLYAVFQELVPKDLEIRVLGEQVAIASAKVFQRGIYLGNAFGRDFRYMRVWRNDGDGWRIVGGSVCAIG